MTLDSAILSQSELCLTGAQVYDGSGGPPFVADVVVSDGRISAVEPFGSARRASILDLSGLALAPGFIDIHTHSDLSLVACPSGESKTLQGVTTEVVGNCGFSAFPLAPERRQDHLGHLHSIGDASILVHRSASFDEYADAVTASGPALNVAAFVGHGTLRLAVMGNDSRHPDFDEMRAMKRLIAESVEQGALGLSTGLTYAPSCFGQPEEIRELVDTVSDYEAVYATHARSDIGEGFPGVSEAIATARDTGARLQFSHAAINEPSKWGRAGEFAGLFEEAERRGVDVAFDVYPYDASSSPMTQYLPLWVQEGGLDAMRRRLADRGERARAEQDVGAGWFGGIPWLWDRVSISSAGPNHSWCIGLTFAQAAEQAGVRPASLLLDLCLEAGNSAWAVLFYREEADVTAFLGHWLAVVGSDGNAVPLDQGSLKPHPRGFGTFPRVLGRYVREARVLSLAEAIHKMTAGVADRLGLADRGRVHPGAAADLVVFNPLTVIDNATFAEPAQAPTGIVHVLVNGIPVVLDGKQTCARPGKLLRRRT